jgi:hypothetical protein
MGKKIAIDPDKLLAAINEILIPAIVKQSPEDFKPKEKSA